MVEIPEHYRLLVATPDNTVEIRMSEYNLPGYTKNHAQITLDVLRENPKLRKLFDEKYC